jgi:hypothetical protein
MLQLDTDRLPDRCTSVSSNLDNRGGGRRTPQHTKAIVEAWGSTAARENYGIVAELVVSF